MKELRVLSKQIAQQRDQVGKEFFHLALAFADISTTIAEREKMVSKLVAEGHRLEGRQGIRYIRQQLDIIVSMIVKARLLRNRNRNRVKRGDKAYRLPVGTPLSRYFSIQKRKLVSVIHHTFQYDACIFLQKITGSRQAVQFPRLYTLIENSLLSPFFSIETIQDRIVVTGKDNTWALEIKQSSGYRLIAKMI